MSDIFDPGGLTDWWDVPADYFSGGDMVDYSQLGGGGGLPDFTGGFGDFGTPGAGIGAGGDQWFFDTQTGQVVSLAEAQQIDPSFIPPANGFSLTGQPQLGGGGGLDPTQYRLPPANDPWWGSVDAKTIIGALTAAGGLGAVGLGIGSLFGGSDAANRTGTQTSAAGQGPRGSEAMQLLGSGGGTLGLPGATGGGGAGLLGLSNMMLQNLMGSGQGGATGGVPGLGQPAPGAQIGQLSPGGGAMALPQGQPQTWPAVPGAAGGQPSGPQQGNWQGYPGYAGGQVPPQGAGQPGGTQQGQPFPGGQPQIGGGQGLIGQQSNVLGGLQSQIPQLNPAIMQALGMQAQGMAQGYLPSLSDPQIQARIQSIYQPGFDALNYNAGLALSNAREQLQQRGFQAPDLREGPTQALTAPILAAQQLGRSQLYGQMAGAQLDLASRLPMLGSQLNAQNFASQAQPFNLGTQLAGAYTQPIATQGQFPLSLLDILERGRGSTSTVNTVGPQPSLTQQLGQLAPLVGAGGNLLSSAGGMLFPQSQNPYGSPRYDPFTGRLLSGV